jgi:hypothetical protein
MRIEAFQMILAGTVFIVVALDAGQVEVPDNFQAFLGVGIVANDITKTDDLRDVLGLDVLQNGVERFQIAVYVCDNGVFHS